MKNLLSVLVLVITVFLSSCRVAHPETNQSVTTYSQPKHEKVYYSHIVSVTEHADGDVYYGYSGSTPGKVLYFEAERGRYAVGDRVEVIW